MFTNEPAEEKYSTPLKWPLAFPPFSHHLQPNVNLNILEWIPKIFFVSYHHRFACKQDNKLLKKQTLKFNNDGKNTFNPFCWHLLACAVYIQGIMHHVLSETRHIFLAFISHVDDEMWKGWWGTEGKKLHHLYLFYVLTQKLLFIFVNNKLDTHYELCDTTREWPGI